jgi:hypothetical protein
VGYRHPDQPGAGVHGALGHLADRLPGQCDPVGEHLAITGEGRNQLVTVLSTLAIAASFAPLRRQVQNAIDRRFYRNRYNAARTVEAFGEGLREEVDLNTLSARLVAVVEETMQPEQVSLWLRPGKRE